MIHLGAKYSPCMRPDSNIDDVLAIDKQVENNTACCVYNDGSGCVQTQADECTVSNTHYNVVNYADGGYVFTPVSNANDSILVEILVNIQIRIQDV